MTLIEFADIVDSTLRIHYYPIRKRKKFCCSFEYAEISVPPILIGESGDGDTPEEAMNDYADKIRGKRLVFNAMSDNRSTYKVPESLGEK